jgi:2-oxoglutarate ferredoxin oxidoreductase subunit beta
VGGDGDAYAIGMGHFMHSLRRNADITYIVMDNHVYGLTKGQTSPTSETGFRTKTSPEGSIEHPVHPLMLAVAGGAGFVAQGFSSWQPQLARLIMDGMNHPGFALINVISPCVTYNRVNSYAWYKKSLVNLDEEPDYDRTSRAKALARLEESDELVTGIVYQETSVPYEDRIPGFLPEPVVQQDTRMDPAVWDTILRQFD